MTKRTCLNAALFLTLTALVGCAGSRAFRDARQEEAVEHWDLAVLRYARAADLEPNNHSYRMALARAKIRASQFHFEKGKMYRASGRPELAVVELDQAVLLDPTNQYAETELRKARDEAAKVAADRAGESRIETLKRQARGSRARPPILEPASDRPINLNFPQPKPIKQIYKALADAAGINVIFDPQLKDDNVSIVLTNMEFQRALETLMRQENHFYKVIDDRTILIAADTPANRKTYEDLVIRTFFLSNADVTEVANALRSLLQTTRISVNKGENSITLRDTADKVAIAERIVEQNDKQLAEVVVDVELLQINTSKTQDLGLLLTAYETKAILESPTGGKTNFGANAPEGTFTWDQLKDISIRSFGFTLPSVSYSFIKNNTDAELLAKPQLRISEGQKAQLVIGDRVPIPTTQFNTSNTIGGSLVPVTSFQYQDVGIKIEVEPRVHHNKEVTLKLTIEVSNLNGFVEVVSGQRQPIIGTRTIASSIRLKDGETNFLAGLFRTDKSNTTNSVPFLGDIPILGRLFSKKATTDTATDLVLTLTPHIIRIPDVTAEDLEPVYVGTDSNISFQGSPRVESPATQGPFDFGSRQPPAVIPRGVPPPQRTVTPAPQILVPGGLPTDPFRPTPNPRDAIPPQPVPTPGAVPESLEGAAPGTDPAATAAGSKAVLFDFDPPALALAPGEVRSVLVRATGGDSSQATTLGIQFDPAVVAVLSVRPILSGFGAGDASVSGGRVVLELRGGVSLSGTRPVAEITLQGVGTGRTRLSFETPSGGSGIVTATDAAVEVRSR
ncbi:MAG TPA: secretin N-terminal domain-containing protein [Thermoanaerobaculia bacterium]|nr:secretin N-terminal domain-containing protein [Thermoanaerobaculia bacterium]